MIPTEAEVRAPYLKMLSRLLKDDAPDYTDLRDFIAVLFFVAIVPLGAFVVRAVVEGGV